MLAILQFKRGYSIASGKTPEWKNTFVLAEGEPGFEIDTDRFKLGDGKRNWEELGYFAPGIAVAISGTPATGNSIFADSPTTAHWGFEREPIESHATGFELKPVHTGKLHKVTTSGGEQTITIPLSTGGNVFTQGDFAQFLQVGTNKVKLVATAGTGSVTIRVPEGSEAKTRGEFCAITVTFLTATELLVSGDTP